MAKLTRQEWRFQLLRDRTIDAGTRCFGLILSDFAGNDRLTCYPSRARLSDEAGQSERTISTHVGILKDAGYLTVDYGRGSGKVNVYRLTLTRRDQIEKWEKRAAEKGKRTSRFDVEKQEADFPFNEQKGEADFLFPDEETGSPAHGNGKPSAQKREAQRRKTGSAFPIEPKREPKREPERELEIYAPSARDDFQPAAFNRDHENAAITEADHADEVTPFDEFWRVYPKRADKIAAQKAFTKAVKLTNAASLIAAAGRYAVEKAGVEPKYIKNPATWLNAGSWENSPEPTRGPVTLDHFGNPIDEPAYRGGSADRGRRLTHDEQVDLAMAEVRQRWGQRTRYSL